jgi:hypothetical protein
MGAIICHSATVSRLHLRGSRARAHLRFGAIDICQDILEPGCPHPAAIMPATQGAGRGRPVSRRVCTKSQVRAIVAGARHAVNSGRPAVRGNASPVITQYGAKLPIEHLADDEYSLHHRQLPDVKNGTISKRKTTRTLRYQVNHPASHFILFRLHGHSRFSILSVTGDSHAETGQAYL